MTFRLYLGLNTLILSRLEFLGITIDTHPHSGCFFRLAPIGVRRTESHIIKKTDSKSLENTILKLKFFVLILWNL